MLWFFVMLLLTLGQELMVMTNDTVDVHTGPHISFEVVTTLDAETPLTVIARAPMGYWLQVEYGDDAEVGWVVTRNLDYPQNFSLRNVPLIDDAPIVNPDFFADDVPELLYTQPILPESIDESMVDVFQAGLEAGNQPDVLTRIGDSISVQSSYLSPMVDDFNRVMQPYEYLDFVVNWFQASTDQFSVAARLGMNSNGAFDPMWSTQNCRVNETPIACEYRTKKPMVAFILFAANDLKLVEPAQYEANMRQIVEESLGAGVIPVLWTVVTEPDGEYWAEALDFNIRIITIGQEYNVPVINLWLAMFDLPRYGLEQDRIHLNRSGYTFLKMDIGNEARYGSDLQNLLILHMLYMLHDALAFDNISYG